MNWFKNIKIRSLSYINPYFLFTALSLFAASLIFSKNVWFDEAYSLSLIQHSYGEVIDIVKMDMHPPLYFVALKFFCDIFGYSLIVTKIFSWIGYVATLLLGCTVVRKHFGQEISVFYLLSTGAIPMVFYFSVQQRAYSWCIFFVALCFVEALLFVQNHKTRHCALFVIAALFAAYNHLFALLAVGIIFAFLNVYALAKNRQLLVKILLADAVMVLGYGGWILPLLQQTKDAYENYWLTGVEGISLVVFAVGILFCALILSRKENRKLSIVFAVVSVMGIQVIGLGVTIFIRPLYIGRYCVVVLGIFTLLLAFAIQNLGKYKTQICIALCILNLTSYIATAMFEYNPSFDRFRERFQSQITTSDTFVYCDSSSGVMAYFYPEYKHFTTYSESWFAAFDNVTSVDKDNIVDAVDPDQTIWFIKTDQNVIPGYIKNNFTYEMHDSFVCDFHTFEVYVLEVAE